MSEQTGKHRRIEAALKESEEQYRALIERANDGVIILQDFRIAYVNRAILEMTGYRREEVIGQPFAIYIHPDERERLVEYYRRRMAGEHVPPMYESALVHSNGRRIEVEVSGGVSIFEGRPADLVIIRDITERKLSERLQMERMERIQQLHNVVINISKSEPMVSGRFHDAIKHITETVVNALEVSKVGVWLFNDDKSEFRSVDVYDSDHELHLSGMMLSESDFRRYYVSLDSDRACAIDDVTSDPRITEFRRRLLKSHGIASIVDAPVRVRGDIVGILSCAHTGQRYWQPYEVAFITEVADQIAIAILSDERRQAEEALREKEEQYRALVENSTDIIMRLDRRHRHLYISPSVRMIVSIKPEEFLGKTHRELGFPEDLCRVWEGGIDHVFETGEMFEQELSFETRSGKFVFNWRLFPEFDQNSEVATVLGILRDISELKRSQEQAAQQARLKALGQLASGIAHDFNNSLSPILGYTELLLQVPELMENREKVREYLKIMNVAAIDASNVVKRLKEFYSSHNPNETFVPIDLNRLVGQVIELTQPKWKDISLARGITIDVRSDLGEIPVIRGNESQLREALTNLIFNSVDAILGDGEIVIRTYQKSDQVVLEVIDNGIGMSEEVRLQCLDPFFTTKGENGTGLGLSMVYGIIRQHGGTLEIDSTEGEGTKVTISLPVDYAREGQGKRSAEGKGIPGSYHVLVVEDDERVLQLLSKFLTADGHTFEPAMDGIEALEKLDGSDFDLVITDLSMPRMNGITLSEVVKAYDPKISVIMITGFGDMINASGEKPETVDVILGKPITLSTFQNALLEAIAIRNHSRSV